MLVSTLYNIGALLRTIATLIAPAAARRAPKGKTWLRDSSAMAAFAENACVIVTDLSLSYLGGNKGVINHCVHGS